VESKATHSVRVPVKNLCRVDPNLDVTVLQEALGYEFLRTSSDGTDGGMTAVSKQRGFQMVRPDDGWYPGLEKLREELVSHQWIFGKTPKFKVNNRYIILTGNTDNSTRSPFKCFNNETYSMRISKIRGVPLRRAFLF
jgi:hypothetical protein